MKKTRNQSFRNQTIADQLNNGRKLIENTQGSPAILATMLKFGYTAADFTAAHLLYSAALNAANDVASKGSDAELATAAAQDALESARGDYAHFTQIARSAFKGNKAVLNTLIPDSIRPRAIAKFILAAGRLYTTTSWTVPVTAKLAKRGISDSWLSTARAGIESLKTALNNQSSLDGAAQDATAAQTTALEALVEWCVEYIAVARVALKKSPQTLEKLGIMVRNSRSQAQIEGAKESATTRKLNREKKAASISKAA